MAGKLVVEILSSPFLIGDMDAQRFNLLPSNHHKKYPRVNVLCEIAMGESQEHLTHTNKPRKFMALPFKMITNRYTCLRIFEWIFMYFHGLSCVFMGFHGFSTSLWVFGRFPGRFPTVIPRGALGPSAAGSSRWGRRLGPGSASGGATLRLSQRV